MGAARKLQVADLFCGAGGTSTGVALACKELDYAVELLAINHWQTAIQTHQKNHPWATHVCANVEAIDPRKVVPGGRLDLLVASPECIWHSTARGGKPINDQARASAWRVLEWCERLHVSNVLIENVPEFKGWGPLGADDRPLKSKRGAIFEQFIASLRAMNYRVEYRVLNAADYGAATSRRRLFILARKGGRRIPWPTQTHARDAGSAGALFTDLKPWRAAREIIDWSVQGQSIFTRKKPLARTTLLRIEAGLKRYGGPLAPLFISALRAHMDCKPAGEPVELQLVNGTAEAFMAVLRGTARDQLDASAHPVSQPVPTVAANGQHVALCEPYITVLNNNNRPKSVDEPAPTVTGGNRLFLTQPEAFVLGQQSGGAPRPVDAPSPTIAGRGAQSLVEPKAFIVPFYGERPGQDGRTHDVDAPLPTAPCSPKFALTEPFVVTPGGPDLPNGRSVSEPLPTVTCGDRMALVNPLVVQTDQTGGNGKCVRSADEPVPTLHTKLNLAVVEPFVVGAGGPQYAGKAQSVDEPLKTVLTENHKMLVQPFILPQNGSNRPRGVDEPVPTLTTTSRGVGIVAPVVVQVNHGGSPAGRTAPVDAPLPAVTTKNGAALVEPSIAKYYGDPEKNLQGVDTPLGTVTCKDRFALIEPQVTRIGIDIRFRMFRTRELARAMGFETYEFTGNTEEQTRQIGNAVEVNQAKALARALLGGRP